VSYFSKASLLAQARMDLIPKNSVPGLEDVKKREITIKAQIS
jgi:hypothetical protein